MHYESVRPENWTLFQAAAHRRSAKLITWMPHLVELRLSDVEISARYAGRPDAPSVLIHRTVFPFQNLLLPVISYWQSQGTMLLNDFAAAIRSRDKLATTIALCAADVQVVPTLAFFAPLEESLSEISTGEVILKPAHGVRGEGIEVFPTANLAARRGSALDNRMEASTLAGYLLLKEHYLAQPLVMGGRTDLRAFVVGQACIGLMRRHAASGEVRANLALGATASVLPLTHPAAAIAVRALTACGLDYGGVDLIEDEEGLIRVLEVDAWAGFSGITRTTGGDVAGAIIDLAISRLKGGI